MQSKLFVLTISLLLCASSSLAQDQTIADKISPQVAQSVENNKRIRILISLDSLVDPRNGIDDNLLDMVSEAQWNFVDTWDDSQGLYIEGTMDYAPTLVGYVDSIEEVEAIAARSDVISIDVDHIRELFTEEGRDLTGSYEVEAISGWTGAGVGVAIIDTQFDLFHNELGGSPTLPNGIAYGAKNFSNPDQDVHSQNFDSAYHGTATSSIIRRYASETDLYLLTVFPNAYDSVIADAIYWCIQHKDGINGGAPIKIISMSLGGGYFQTSCNSGIMHQAASDALAAGILLFAASGNNGWNDAIASPACSDSVISVGASWDSNQPFYTPFSPANCNDYDRQVDERTCYSNTSNILDLYAPSEQVSCAKVGGGTFSLGGTSSAAPAAAGMIAQLLEAAPELQGYKYLVSTLLHDSGEEVAGDISKRRVNIAKAASKLTVFLNQPKPQLNFVPIEADGLQIYNKSTAEFSTINTNENVRFHVDIPKDSTNFRVNLHGDGDLDLYVKHGNFNWPEDRGHHYTSEFKAPWTYDSNESVVFQNPASGFWIILVDAYLTGSGTITASWDGTNVIENSEIQSIDLMPQFLANGSSVEIMLEKDEFTEYRVNIPYNSTNFHVSMAGNGDMDLYVKKSPVIWPDDQGQHDTNDFKSRSTWTSNENISFSEPSDGTWYILVYGYQGGKADMTVSWGEAEGNTADAEQTEVENFVSQFYINCLNRFPDMEGLAGWVNALQNGIINGGQMAKNFIFSKEFVALNTSNEEFITILYHSFMGRDPDLSGFNGWVNNLDNGMPRTTVLENFINSIEFENRCKEYGISAF